MSYARPYKRQIAVFLALVILDSALVVAVPLLFGEIIDKGVIRRRSDVVVRLSLIIAALAVVDGVLTLIQRWYSSRIGEGLIFDLRTQVFTHVLKQPIAFFTRAQTGALVSRLNNDVIGAQQAFTSTLSGVVSNVVSLVFIVFAMAAKSWVLTLAALALLPFFLIPARVMGARLAGLSHEAMGLNAELGTRMTERFNVAGALLVKLFGQPRIEDEQYSERAGRVRDIGVKIALNRTVFFVALTMVASLATALVYGAGGVMVVNSGLTVGALLALAALLGRLYGPLTALSNVRVDVMTALVSFERVFEVLDLEPLVKEAASPVVLPKRPVSVEFDGSATRQRTRSRWPPSRRSPRVTARPGGRCSATSPSRSSPARWSRSWVRAAQARPRSPLWWPGSTTPQTVTSASAGSTCATPRSAPCMTSSAW